MKTLVADDDVDCQNLLLEILPEWDYEVQCVSNGSSAWEVLCGKEPPSLIILDWVMPGIDGVNLCRRLRKHVQQQPPYIILLTSRSQPQDIVRALEAGADDYLIKPFDLDELRARIQAGRRILDLQARSREQERLRGILQMAGTVCHEMNQPLQIILTAVQLLSLNFQTDDPNFEHLHAIQQGIKRLGDVTGRVMNIAQCHTKNYLNDQTQIVDLTNAAATCSCLEPHVISQTPTLN